MATTLGTDGVTGMVKVFQVIGLKKSGVTYKERKAVRVIVKNQDGKIIIHVENGNYYKLPGGGYRISRRPSSGGHEGGQRGDGV